MDPRPQKIPKYFQRSKTTSAVESHLSNGAEKHQRGVLKEKNEIETYILLAGPIFRGKCLVDLHSS